MSSEAAPVAAHARPAAAARRGAAQALPGRGREPQPADRDRGDLPAAVRLHRADVADDERSRRSRRKLWPDPFAWHNYVDVFSKAPLWRYALNTLALRRASPRSACCVSSIPVAYALARLRWRGSNVGVPDHARRDDAAAAGDDRAGLRALGEAAPRRHALAADLPELARRRVLDLPAAPVLPDDPRGVPRRRARGRLRRVPDPDDRRPAGWRSRRSRRSRCSRSSSASTTSSGRCSTRARTRSTGRSRSGCRSSARSTRCSGT